MPDVCLFFVLLFTIFIIVVTQKTSSTAVQKRHSKVYGKPIAPSLYSILFGVNQVKFKNETEKMTTYILAYIYRLVTDCGFLPGKRRGLYFREIPSPPLALERKKVKKRFFVSPFLTFFVP